MNKKIWVFTEWSLQHSCCYSNTLTSNIRTHFRRSTGVASFTVAVANTRIPGLGLSEVGQRTPCTWEFVIHLAPYNVHRQGGSGHIVKPTNPAGTRGARKFPLGPVALMKRVWLGSPKLWYPKFKIKTSSTASFIHWGRLSSQMLNTLEDSWPSDDSEMSRILWGGCSRSKNLHFLHLRVVQSVVMVEEGLARAMMGQTFKVSICNNLILFITSPMVDFSWNIH